MRDKQDRAYSGNKESLEKFGLVRRVCGTNTVHVIPSKICQEEGEVPVCGFFITNGVFVQTPGNVMHVSRNNIFESGASLAFVRLHIQLSGA